MRMYQGPTVILPAAARSSQPASVLGPDLEIVVDDGQLPVEEEVGVGAVPLHLVEQSVDQTDQLQPEGLEGLVPLAVPVGVGNHRDPSGRGLVRQSHRCFLPCQNR